MRLKHATIRDVPPRAREPARPSSDARDDAPAPPVGDPEQWLAEHGDALYRFALLHLGRPERAEDAVQETLLAAIRGRDRVVRADCVRAWLLGIMRHKVADQLRRDMTRRRHAAALTDVSLGCGGAPRDAPLLPAGAPESAELRQALESSIQRLPELMRAAFCLRTISELGTVEICDLLGVSANHLGVLVHRARMQLRDWLAEEFAGPGDPASGDTGSGDPGSGDTGAAG